MSHMRFTAQLLAACLGCLALCATAASNSAEPGAQPPSVKADTSSAIEQLRRAAESYEKSGDMLQQSQAHANMAEVYQSGGNHPLALEHWAKAVQLAGQLDDRAWQAALYGYLGGSYLSLNRLSEAQEALDAGLQLATATGDPVAEALIRNNLGHLFERREQYAKARLEYDKVIALARQTDNQSLIAKAAQSIAESQLESGETAEVVAYLDEAWAASTRLQDSSGKAFLMVRNAQALQTLAAQQADGSAGLLQKADTRLRRAAGIADAVGDRRTASYAYGYRGQLYEAGERYDEAIESTHRALMLVQPLYAPELAYRWEWQLGRLYDAKGEWGAAIDAYRRAVTSLQSIRAEFATGNADIAGAFRRDAGPVFLELADLLLRQSDATRDPAVRQSLLVEARETIELVKATELQNYFEDDCVAAVRERMRDIDATIVAGTAVLYPITLPDRLELLVSLPTGLTKYTVPVAQAQLVDEVHRFRQLLEKRTTRQYLRQAMQLYRWLIEPLADDLQAHRIQTLVVVPDSALRGIPLAALHDGKDFLIRRYAVAMTPSLQLTDPRPIRRDDMTLLLNGLTQSVQGFPPLVHVSTELEAIHELYGGKVLENESFRKASVKHELVEQQYSVVHFATHGKFAGNVSESFILTYDGRMSMDDLEQFVGVSRFRLDRPVELLTLSACETATGDDTAALGLASVAIKAGARSALASLWSINDEASSELVSVFYQHLSDADVSKAEALQRAQTQFLDDLRYRHPGYWAPFLLIGNWL